VLLTLVPAPLPSVGRRRELKSAVFLKAFLQRRFQILCLLLHFHLHCFLVQRCPQLSLPLVTAAVVVVAASSERLIEV
jgi:hypothetical protein